jgi:hypothetical protein
MPNTLESALLANRSRYNSRFAEARHYQPRLDSEEFARLLRTLAAPIAEAVQAIAPPALDPVVEALYDICLDLLAHDFLGPNSRYPFIAAGWQQALPKLARYLASDPRAVIGAVTNALYNLSLTPGARPADWLADVITLAGLEPELDALLKAGQVCAWRAGLAHYRPDALALCRSLPAALACAALGLPASGQPALDAALTRLAADPWYRPAVGVAGAAQLKIVARAGAFRGFGGLFLAPPIVEPAGEHFLVTDGEGVWLLTADAFGATFHRAARPDASPPTATGFRINRAGKVSLGKTEAAFPQLAGSTSSAGNAVTLAVTAPYSHAIYLVARA